MNYWGGIVLKLPENVIKGLDGSTFTLHYYTGTDTKNTGKEAQDPQLPQVENTFTRISPQINIRYNEAWDIQAAYVIGTDDNYYFAADKKDFNYSGFALEAGYMPNDSWHFGLHYDNYSSDEKIAATGKPVLDFQRIVPTVTYIINQNVRCTIYYEKNLTDIDESLKVDKAYLNIRVMF